MINPKPITPGICGYYVQFVFSIFIFWKIKCSQAAHPYLASTGLAQKHPSGLFNKVEPNSDVFILCGSN